MKSIVLKKEALGFVPPEKVRVLRFSSIANRLSGKINRSARVYVRRT